MTTNNVITTQPVGNHARISDQPPSYEEISAQPLSDVVENVNTKLTSMNIDAVQESATGNAKDEERKRQNHHRSDDCCFVYDDIDCIIYKWFSNCCQRLADCTESCCEGCADCLHDCCESNTVEEYNDDGFCELNTVEEYNDGGCCESSTVEEYNDGGCCESSTVEEYNDGGCCDSGDCYGGDSGNNDNDCD
ncbi:unnamed protein product [Parnassius apollo]|uniref:(apollo) hypothetical protein n=1 Tax=Parnassius apollo TaxID=110799 RepID=A0A8S3XAM1_PARAO|nr:unnamed protein product [Parnassius apollo]